MKALLGLVVAALGFVGAPWAPPAQADAGASVPVGGGRQVFLQCLGSGRPTVLIIPGKGSYAQAWNVVVPPDDPVRSSPYDLIEQARLHPSPTAVQPAVAATTTVCAYDRPNTRPDGEHRSTPVPQPHTVGADVGDVVRLVAAAGLSTPLVVIGHSYGGLVADLLARTHPELVAALVMIDPVSEFLPAVGSPTQNAAFFRDLAVPPEPGGEAVLGADAFAAVAAAPPLPRVPAVVISSEKFPPPERLSPDNYTHAQIVTANTMLADALGTTNITAPGAGHNVMLYTPGFVVDQIDRLVAQVRAGDR